MNKSTLNRRAIILPRETSPCDSGVSPSSNTKVKERRIFQQKTPEKVNPLDVIVPQNHEEQVFRRKEPTQHRVFASPDCETDKNSHDKRKETETMDKGSQRKDRVEPPDFGSIKFHSSKKSTSKKNAIKEAERQLEELKLEALNREIEEQRKKIRESCTEDPKNEANLTKSQTYASYIKEKHDTIRKNRENTKRLFSELSHQPQQSQPQQSQPVYEEVNHGSLYSYTVPYIRGKPGIPDYSKMSHVEVEQLKTKFWTQIDIIMEKNPTWNVELPERDASIEVLHQFYSDLVMRIKVTSSVDSWKVGLALILIIIEGIMNKWGWFDMTGFAQFQTEQIKKNDDVLIELGEKYISTGEGSASPEMKMIMSVGFNIFMFIAVKVISNLTGFSIKDITGWVSDLLGSTFSMSGVSDPNEKSSGKAKNDFSPEPIPETSNSGGGSGVLNMLGGILGAKPGGSVAEMTAKIGAIATKKVHESSSASKTKKKRTLPKVGV